MNPVTIIQDAFLGPLGVGGIDEKLGLIAGLGLGVGVSIFALSKGWSLLRRFVN